MANIPTAVYTDINFNCDLSFPDHKDGTLLIRVLV